MSSQRCKYVDILYLCVQISRSRVFLGNCASDSSVATLIFLQDNTIQYLFAVPVIGLYYTNVLRMD